MRLIIDRLRQFMTRLGAKLAFLFKETAGGSGNRCQGGPEVVGNRTEDGIAHPFCLHRNVCLLRFVGQAGTFQCKGYLISQGYEQVRFLPEQTKVKTPDLRAHAALSTIVMEVKTVNESNKQKHYFEIPGEQRIALETEYHLSRALKAKLNSAIQVARTQLLAVQDPTVIRRIVYLVIRPDFQIEAHEELEIFLQTQSTSELEVIHHLLG